MNRGLHPKTPFLPAAILPAALLLASATTAPALTDGMARAAAAEMLELDRALAALDAAEEATAQRGADTLSRSAEGEAAANRGDGADWTFEARDESANYTAGTDWNGQNGGSGFEAWESTGPDEPADRTVSATATSAGLYMQAKEDPGVIVMKREFGETAGAGLVEGTASVKAWGYADESDDFVGFALYDGNSEIFRWGLGLTEGLEGEDVFKYSTDGGLSYVSLFYGYPADGPDYTLTWASLGTGTTLTLSEASYFPEGRTVTLDHPVHVTAIAAVLEEGGIESGGGNGTEMTFDNLSVRGKPDPSPPSVPEPATSALLLSGLAALFLRRRAR